jgi:acyl-ACP thioesterase
MEVMPE